MQGRFDLPHGLEIVQGHEVEAEAVELVFLRPVADRVDHVLAEHRALRGRLVAAAAAVRGAAVVCEAVVIIGDDAVEIGIETEGMVVHHVHHHADPGLVQALHHLLELVHAHRAVIGVGGVAALGDVVVLRVVAPVELRRVRALVHGGVVVDRLEVDVRDPEILQVVQADRLARGVRKARLGEGEVLAGIARAGDRVGEVAHVHLPDHGVGVGAQFALELRGAEALRIGRAEVDHHAALAVHAGRAGVGIHGLPRAEAGRDGVGVIGPVPAGINGGPHALFALFHRELGKGLAALARFEQPQRDRARRRGPELEFRLAAADRRAEVVAVIDVLRDEFLAVENVRRHGGDAAVARDLHGIAAGEVERLGERDRPEHDLVAEAAQALERESPVAVKHADLVERGDARRGGYDIADLRRGEDARHFEHADGIQSQATVLAGILHLLAADEIDLGALARESGEAVSVEVLCRAAPGAPAGLGAVAPDDEADLFDLHRHVQDHLAAVGAGVEELAVALLSGVPDPDVAVFIALVRTLPVKRQLTAAGLGRERVFLLRRGGTPARFRFGGRLRGRSLLRRGSGRGAAAREQREQQQRREHEGEYPVRFHGRSPLFKFIRRFCRRMRGKKRSVQSASSLFSAARRMLRQ